MPDKTPHLSARERLLEALRLGLACPHPAGRIREGGFGPSPSQQAILAAEALHPGSIVNTVGATAELGPAHSVGDLIGRIAAIARKEDVFRTAIVATDGGAGTLRLLPTVEPAIEMHDLTAFGAVEAETEAGRHVSALLARRFDLGRPPLVRFAVLAMPEGRMRVAVAAHHVVADLASLGILMRRLTAEDRGEAPGHAADPACLDPSPAPDEAAAAVAHFRRRLDGVALDAPLIAPMLADRAGDLACRRLVARPGVSPADLRRLARALGATPFEILLAAFATSLACLSGASALVLGLPVSLRKVDAKTLGCHVGLLPFAVRVAKEQTFRRLAAEVAADLRADLGHAALPLSTLLSALGVERPAGGHPLFQATFTAFDAAIDGDGGPDFALLPRQDSVFDLCCDIAIGGEAIDASIDIRPGRIRPAAAQLALDGCFAILRAALADPAIVPADLVARLVARDDRDAERFSGRPPSLDDILDEIARHDPEKIAVEMALAAIAIAAEAGAGHPPLPAGISPTRGEIRRVVAGDLPISPLVGEMAGRPEGGTWHRPPPISPDIKTITYGELNANSAAVANALRRRGLGEGDLVAILLKRSPALPAAILGVLRAGAAYLPLDPNLPAERLRSFLARSAPAALLASRSTLPALGDAILPAHVLDIAELDSPAPAPAPARRTDDAARAYSIFTSGSTGIPKVVDIPRRALANIVASVADECDLGDGRFLSATTIAFDIAALELLLPLNRGGTLRLAGDDEARDPWALAALLNDPATRAFQTTPSRLRTILDTGALIGHGGLTLLVGGEPLPQALAERVCPCCGTLLNMYGPTETTIWSAYGEPFGPGGVTVGHPARHTRIRVLGPGNRPVAPGFPGEIAIGGRGLALGYAGDAALTDARFVADPEAPGERLFLTGDIGARDEDGRLYVAGRRDEQLKIRGHRIEPAEVEAALEALGSGGRAAVFGVEHSGELQLHAAVAGAADEAALLSGLRRTLPGAMIPSRLHRVAAIPTTAAGKTDRQALRAMAEAADAAPEPPEIVAKDTGTGTDALDLIAALFRRHGISDPRPDGDFFALGGDSIRLVRLIAGIGEALSVTLPVRLVLAGRVTPRRLAMLVAAESARPREAECDALLARLETLSDEAAVAALAAGSLEPGEAAWTREG